MEDYTNNLLKTLTDDSLNPYRNAGDRHRRETNAGDDEEEDCDHEVWNTLSGGFERVQSVLDQNRALIQQVNENHQSKIPENLVKNVALIREINANISKVVSIYSDLSVYFTNLVRQRKALLNNSNCDVKSGNGGS